MFILGLVILGFKILGVKELGLWEEKEVIMGVGFIFSCVFLNLNFVIGLFEDLM